MTVKKPKKLKRPDEINIDNAIIFNERLLSEATEWHFLILKALKEEVKNLSFQNLDRVVDIERLRNRFAALEKAESDRQAHEVTK